MHVASKISIAIIHVELAVFLHEAKEHIAALDHSRCSKGLVNSLDGRQKKTCCQEKLLGLKTSSYEFPGEKKTAL